MKKKLAAFLCGVMCVTAFTGCSDTELAYLKMSSDLLDTMSSCKVSGQVKADVDFDVLRDYIVDVAEAANSTPDLSGLEGLNGNKSVRLDYDMQMNLDTLEYDMAFDVSYEGKKYDLGDFYYSLTKGVYYSTDGIWGMYEMAGDLVDDSYQDSYFFSDAYGADLKAALAQDKYIELISVEDLTGWQMEEALPKNGFADLYDAVFTFYEDVFEGFETGMVSQIPGGYAVEADGRDVAELLMAFLEFAAENPDQILNATEVYLNAVTDQTAMSAEEKAAVQEMFAMARGNKEAFVMAAAEICALMQAVMAEESVQMVLDSFDYKAVVKKENGGFASQENYRVSHEGKNVCSIVGKTAMQATAVKLKFPVDGISADELSEKLDGLNDKHNPVNGVCVSWGWEDTATEALLYPLCAEEAPFGMTDGAVWTELMVQKGRAYVPLRMICDLLGEDVVWDKTTKTAYVRVDGVKTELDGILQDGISYVGVREFEKMGYTVDYSSVDGMKEAVIQK